MKSINDLYSRDLNLWGEAAAQNMLAIGRPIRRVTGRISLPYVLSITPRGGLIQLEEEIYYLYEDLTIRVDNLILQGRGEKSIIRLMRDVQIKWLGQGGLLRDIQIRGASEAISDRAPTHYFLVVEGAGFELNRVQLDNLQDGVHVTRQAANARLLHSKTTNQRGVGFFVEGPDALLFDLESTASPAPHELDIRGDRAWVGACRCIGGGINIIGAGAIDAGNFV